MNDQEGTVGTTRVRRVVPTRTHAFIALLFGAAAARTAGSLNLTATTHAAWRDVLPLFALLVAAERMMMRFRYRGQIDGITLFEAALAPALVALPIPAFVILVAAAQATAAVIGRDPAIKAAFNVAQWSAAAAIGGIVFHLLANDGGLSTGTILALVAALTAVAIANITSFTYMMHLVQGEPVRTVLQGFTPLLPVWGITWLVNICFGIIFNASYTWSTLSALLFFIPLAMLHWASRGYAAVVVDQERLAGMHRASRLLSEPVDPREAIPAFLEEVRRCFSSEVADLILLDNQVRHLYRARAGAETAHTTEPFADDESLVSLLIDVPTTTRVRTKAGTALAAVLKEAGFRDCLAAPLFDGARTVGVLCTYNRNGMEGFDEGEAAVLESLAGEVARSMIKAGLLETILEERQKLSDIVGSTSDGILTLGPDGVIKTWNPALERMTGYAPGQIVGSHLFSILDVRDTNGHGVCLESWASHDATLPEDLEIRSYSGEPRWLSCSYARVREAEGRPTMLIIVARDVTEARELERLKDDFVATVSHELRTPLTPIKGWAVTLLQLGTALDESQREEGVRTILRHADRLERLITNLLEVSRIERGLAERREAIVDVQAITEKVVSDYTAEQSRRDIRLTVTPGTYRTRGDEVWLEQIVSNLLSNAMKYAPPLEPIDVMVSGTGDAIEVAVQDHGPGIPEAEAERIFERFKRLGDHMTRSQGGTGLGLYIARQLARAIGGELSVRNTPGHGATFVLTLHRTEELVQVAS
ncbi:MAG: ATP-binding protein [Actinomycetota bacterium]